MLSSQYVRSCQEIENTPMNWVERQYDDRAVYNKAAIELLKSQPRTPEYEEALTIVNNWRDSHFYPLNTFKVTLRRKAKQVYRRALVSERRKRLVSILAKLRDRSSMRLTQMQDIAGCRVVTGSVKTVYELVDVYKHSDLKHKLLSMDDYISKPRASGYRGVHLIYAYFSDKHDTYNGLKVELQFRSPLQHAWATAVETVGAFLKQALKSSQGHQGWLRFFELMGSYIALREKTALVPNTPTNPRELRQEIHYHATELRVSQNLQSFRMGLDAIRDKDLKGAKYYLLELDASIPKLDITGYKNWQRETALEATKTAEKKTGFDVVLVSVDELTKLRRAYPNYYADTDVFLRIVREAVGSPIDSLPRVKIED